jgi:hypothetical protein
MRPGAWLRTVALFALLWSSSPAVAADAGAAPEYRVKAAFVYKFGDYVEWPPEAFARADSPLVFGVVENDVLADELARLAAGRTMGGRAVVVRKLAAGDSWTGLHVAFVGGDDADKLSAALAAGAGRPVLTVTETRAGSVVAGMINFVVVADKVRFDVALPAAEAAGLKISSRLLSVARRVDAP